MVDAFADHGEGSDGAVLADLRGGRDVGERMNSAGRLGRLIEERQGAGEIEIRIFGNQAGDGIFDRLRDQDGAGLGVFDLVARTWDWPER